MKKIITLLSVTFVLLTACNKDDVASILLKDVTFDSNANSKLLFQGNTVINNTEMEKYKFYVNNVVRVKPIDNTSIEIINFAPIDLENVVILASFDGKENVRLFNIKKIGAHRRATMKYPFVEGTSVFSTTSGEVIQLLEYKQNGIAADKITFSFTGSADNVNVQKLLNIKNVKWEVKFHNFDPNNDPNNNWRPTTFKEARRYSGLMINMAQIYASDEFKNQFIKEGIIDNDGKTLLSTDQKKALYEKQLNHKRFNVGYVTNVSGLGGGYTLGYAEHVLKDYINKDASFILAHEVGHCVGYNHSSNMTYPRKVNNVDTGVCPVMSRVNAKFTKDGTYLVNLNNYYLRTDFPN